MKMSETDRKTKVAIVGAGLSGLACAKALGRAGHAVRVFDKGRGPGGRAATRRSEVQGVEVGFDHGAQYFTVRDDQLAMCVSEWERHGVVQLWEGTIAVLGRSGTVESFSTKARYVGTPGMSAISQHLAQGQDVRCGVTVGRIESKPGGVSVLDRNGDSLGDFEFAVVTAPPEQTKTLVSEASEAIVARAASVVMKPCWAVMAVFEPKLEVPYDGAFINEGPLSWIARTSSKPSRAETPDRWVLHGSAAWSTSHLEDEPDAVAPQLLDACFEATGAPPIAPIWIRAHRWRYALAENPLEDGCLFDESARIAACGDWTCGNRVEGAFVAGLDAARRVDAGLRAIASGPRTAWRPEQRR